MAGRVLTHNATGYRRGCRCDECRSCEARRRREQRARNRKPCAVCNRVHPGRCTPEDQRAQTVAVSLPGHVARRLKDRIGWGDRSGWVAQLVEDELDRIEAQGDAA